MFYLSADHQRRFTEVMQRLDKMDQRFAMQGIFSTEVSSTPE